MNALPGSTIAIVNLVAERAGHRPALSFCLDKRKDNPASPSPDLLDSFIP